MSTKKVKKGDVVEFKADVEQIGVLKDIRGDIAYIEVTDPRTGRKRIHKDYVDCLFVI